ncbi:hypothetical protein DDD64_08685 [Actinotignum sanguinis]|uniref:hypothetical protein n=1 Tax=Actinotignum sanguinis TaxID=1445614 RepID=UPI000F7F705C|nr:hypothetical protein [Actinotignum sanguinis]MDY5147530.1 hypothetical protein [Actinotignum sanguinis]RTE47594.1 hypothetical protein DDD64_08685 [Actinotignum sanguinis]
MAEEMRVITPKYQATLEPPVIGAVLVDASVSYDGLPVAIWSTNEDYRKFFGRSNGGCTANEYVDGIVDALLTRHNAGVKSWVVVYLCSRIMIVILWFRY